MAVVTFYDSFKNWLVPAVVGRLMRTTTKRQWVRQHSAILPLEFRGDRRFNRFPRQSRCQHRQGIVQIDHGVDSATEKVQRLHPRIPQKVSLPITFLGGFRAQALHKNLGFIRVGGVLQGRLFIYLSLIISTPRSLLPSSIKITSRLSDS